MLQGHILGSSQAGRVSLGRVMDMDADVVMVVGPLSASWPSGSNWRHVRFTLNEPGAIWSRGVCWMGGLAVWGAGFELSSSRQRGRANGLGGGQIRGRRHSVGRLSRW